MTDRLFQPISVTLAILLFVSSWAYYAHLSFKFPALLNIDNHVNLQATSYIEQHWRIPRVSADTDDIEFTSLGTTRSLRPPLTYLVSAAVAVISNPFLDGRVERYRLGSTLIAALTLVVVFFGLYCGLKNVGLALLGTVLLALLPRFVFLATCNNDDIGAVFSASVLFSAVLALSRFGGTKFVLFYLAFAFGLILQTKFTAWLFLPWVGVYCLWQLRADRWQLLRVSPALLMMVFIAGAWWPILNMVNYGMTDPSALIHAANIQVELTGSKASARGYLSQGVSALALLGNHDAFVAKSLASFIGYLDWIQLDVGSPNYVFYGAIFLLAIAWPIAQFRSAKPSQQLLFGLIGVLLINQMIFYLHHNLSRDIQPEGRYLLPLVLPLLYCFLTTLQRGGAQDRISVVRARFLSSRKIVISCMLFLCLVIHIMTLKAVIQSFSDPGLTDVEPSQGITYSINRLAVVTRSKALGVQLKHNEVELRREARGEASLTLEPAFCDLLSKNSRIEFEIGASVSGALILTIERDHVLKKSKRYWRAITPGVTHLYYDIDGSDCARVHISLGKNTHLIKMSKVLIQELKTL